MSNFRMVSWNCHYGLTEDKRKAIGKYEADILVVEECSQKDWEDLKGQYGASADWHGDEKDSNGSPERNLGIFVLCKAGITLDRLYKCEDVKHRYVLPYKIGGTKELTLVAVWTKKPDKIGDNYHTPVFEALEDKDYATKILNDTPAILIGDFNTGSVEGAKSAHWYDDLKSRLLREKSLINCASDQEWVPTFFRGNGSWLDDHCFVTESLYPKVISFGIGNPHYWRKFSDHCPIIVDFDF